jgi:hypothetical protein
VNTGKAKPPLSALLTSNNTHYKFDSPPMAAQKTDRPSRYGKIWHICRTLPTLDCLSDRELGDAIDHSLDNHLPMLRTFDEGLPVHLHRKSQAAWLEFTCVTVHVCNSMTELHLERRHATAMMQHIDLLYRVDDFMESLVETYGIHDMSAAFHTLRRCFQPYLDLSANLHAPYHRSHKIDSPVEAFPAIENPVQLEQDLQDVIKRMHTYPITEATSKIGNGTRSNSTISSSPNCSNSTASRQIRTPPDNSTNGSRMSALDQPAQNTHSLCSPASSQPRRKRGAGAHHCSSTLPRNSHSTLAWNSGC